MAANIFPSLSRNLILPRAVSGQGRDERALQGGTLAAKSAPESRPHIGPAAPQSSW